MGRLRWRGLRLSALAVLFLFLLPVLTHGLWFWSRGWPAGWSQASWSSAGVLPPAASEPGPVIHVLGARVGRWRGIFAHHLWLVVKAEGARSYTRYDVVGWGEPMRTDHRAADARWFGNAPDVLATLRGEAAAEALPALMAAIASYPHARAGTYRAWPGPNSNSFVAHAVRAVPDLAPALIPTAVGKDHRADGRLLGLAPSQTGIQFTLGGFAGLTLGWVEGVEINLLGLTAGLDLRRPALKLPGWGRLGLAPQPMA
jgi:hypothetical protein